jgi:DNA polymerase-3 subunit epsilon
VSSLAAKLRARRQAAQVETESAPALEVVPPPTEPAPIPASPVVVGALDLGRPLRGCPVAVIDVETTGIDTAEARIVEIAAVLVDELGVSEPRVALPTRVNPGIPIPPDATKVHGIGDADVEGAPTFAEIWPQLVDATAGRLVVAYNAPYDQRVVAAEIARHIAPADPGPNPAPQLLWGLWVDPFVAAKLVDKFEKGKRLADVAARRGIEVDAHGAAGDAVTTALLLPKLLGEAARHVDRRGRPTQGRPTSLDLASIGNFLAWQRATALLQERELIEFRKGSCTTETPWHDLEGVEPPPQNVRQVDTSQPCARCGAPIVLAVGKDGAVGQLSPATREPHACLKPRPDDALAKGARIRERRLDLLPTIDRDEVARRLGVDAAGLLAIEEGRRHPPLGWDVVDARFAEMLEEHVAAEMGRGKHWTDLGMPAWSAADIQAAADAVAAKRGGSDVH